VTKLKLCHICVHLFDTDFAQSQFQVDFLQSIDNLRQRLFHFFRTENSDFCGWFLTIFAADTLVTTLLAIRSNVPVGKHPQSDDR